MGTSDGQLTPPAMRFSHCVVGNAGDNWEEETSPYPFLLTDIMVLRVVS
jgi:hypothetical protein